MKKSILLSALTVSLMTASGYAQSVEELLGISVSAVQTPTEAPESSHAHAEESPFYARMLVTPIIQGSINTNSTTNNVTLSDSKIEFDVGVGVGLTIGYRIPETYVFLEVASGFQWAGIRKFTGRYFANDIFIDDLEGENGNFYQIPLMFTPGFEFEWNGGWPFLRGGALRFGPSVGMSWQDLNVSEIRGFGDDTFSFGAKGWTFSYGAMVSIDLFFEHNVAFTFGYQFIGTAGLDYGQMEYQGPANPVLPSVDSNFTYTNVVSCGISIYF